MNVLFCGDVGVSEGIYLSSLSLCKYAQGPINIYVLTASVGERAAISNEFAAQLQSVLKQKNEKHRVILLNITPVFENYLPLANMGTRFTPLCMLRLFADLVTEIPDKILYLDTDVLCHGKFQELYELDITDYDIAGVPDRYGKWFFGNVFRHDYFNSGVLLMNMEKIRKDSLFENCRKMCRDEKMFMPDQSALNKLAIKRKISGKYNNQGKIKKDTVFKHFTTFFKFGPWLKAVTIKPWQVDQLHEQLKIFEFDDIIEEYQRSIRNE